ncbi:MAG: TetR/AcrR family transcriptional regulator [Microthrixaceae bacterium]
MSQPATGRRARNRVARHDQLMLAAGEILAVEGLEGLTMMAVADRVGCAVGTIYTYFDSKSALLSALQSEAIQRLMGTYHAAAEMWEIHLDDSDVDESTAALARAVAMGSLFVAAGDLHPREFEMLQMLITIKQDLTTNADRDAVLPVALAFLNDIRAVIDGAVEAEALNPCGDTAYAGATSPPDSSFDRTLRWIGAMNGALLVSNVGIDPERIDPVIFDGRRLALSLAHDLLLAWGADPDKLVAAHALVDEMENAGHLLPVVPSGAAIDSVATEATPSTSDEPA